MYEKSSAKVEETARICSMTDAMVRCMQQPGALAVAFVEKKTGRAIAGDGIQNLDIDAITPILTAFVLMDYSLRTQNDSAHCNSWEQPEKSGDSLVDVTLTRAERFHLLYPLSHDAKDLYLYLALDRVKGNPALSRRSLAEINTSLHL